MKFFFFSSAIKQKVEFLYQNFFVQVQVDNDEPFRILIELRPDMAPKVSTAKHTFGKEI